MAQKSGGVRLLQEGDEKLINPFNRPVVGWVPTSQGYGGLCNPDAGFAAPRVVIQKLIEGKLKDLYDQPVIPETLGAIVVAVLKSKDGPPRVACNKSYRMVGERIKVAEPRYIQWLQEEKHWGELMDSLGEWRWEVARGLPPAKLQGDFSSDEELALACARLEALGEAGLVLDNLKVISRVNPDPTFITHAQWVVGGDIVGQQQQQPEDLEIIGAVRLFTAEEIRSMVSGQKIDDCAFDDGISKAALADAAFHY